VVLQKKEFIRVHNHTPAKPGKSVPMSLDDINFASQREMAKDYQQPDILTHMSVAHRNRKLFPLDRDPSAQFSNLLFVGERRAQVDFRMSPTGMATMISMVEGRILLQLIRPTRNNINMYQKWLRWDERRYEL
jgi:hypothetical protein